MTDQHHHSNSNPSSDEDDHPLTTGSSSSTPPLPPVTTTSSGGTADNNNTNSTTSPQKQIWAWPWIIFIIFLYIFIILWMNYAILLRYWIYHKWNDSLPGFDATFLRKFTMLMHMTTGAVSILLGPIQFVTYFRQKQHLKWIHRYSGRLYCICGMSSSVFGLWFIALKKRLVGGYNMTIAFTLAGLAIGILSFRAWQTARIAKLTQISTTTTKLSSLYATHRNWAIRSYSQILAPALYRYWYAMMELFGWYNTPKPLRLGGYCDSHDYCPDYARTWDGIYCWVYWISAWIVAEIIIYCLPPLHKMDTHNDGNDDTVASSESMINNTTAITTPLLLSNETTIINNISTRETHPDPSSTTYGVYDQQSSRSPFVVEATRTNDAASEKNVAPMVVNGVGILLATTTVSVTGATLVAMFTPSSD